MRSLTLTAATAAACLFAGCASTMAQPPSAQVTRIDNPEPAGAPSAALSLLATREGRMQAQPLNWDVTRGEVSPTALESAELSATPPGPPGSTPGGTPDPAANAAAESLYESEWQGLRGLEAGFAAPEAGDVNFGTQDVFTQYCENCASVNLAYPQVAIGKLFTSGGTCSASVVSGQNVVVTAAHCCYDRGAGNWIGGWNFAPAYRDGFAPYGLFDWSSAAVLTSWVTVGDRRSDVCVIKLRNDSSGRGVTFYTGWLGRSWNFSTTQVHHALGYPGNLGGTEKLELCVSESFNPNNTCGGASVLNTGCSMTFGSSGGPWVRHYRGGNWVNSVVSGYDSGTCTGSFGSTFNGPRFTSDNIVTLCSSLGC
jgi:V8-like Glu-specific endopeptidase